MVTSAFFQICSLFYSILLTIIYFSKNRLNVIENKIYSSLIIFNLFGLIIDIMLTTLLVNLDKSFIITIFLSRFYLVYLLAWTFAFTFYVYVISKKRNEPDENVNKLTYYKKTFIPIVIFFIVSCILVFVLPVNLVNENGIYSNGPGVDYVYLVTAICIFVWFIRLLMNIKEINQKKYAPIFVFLVIGAAVVIVQSQNPSLLLMTPLHTFLTFLMYFTIENPDMQLIGELNIAKDQAEKANTAKTEFLSNMSHEIRTPLNAIVGFSQTVSEGDVPKELEEDVNNIIMASKNLLEIVNGILDISKIEANKLEIVDNEYRINKMLDEVVALTRGRLGNKPLDFRVSIDKSIPPVLYGDHNRIKQIVINLLTNAVKYTKEGFVEFKVDSVTKGNTCRLIFSVEDSGIGIQKDKIDKLFIKFERNDVEKNTSIEGTGLGLAIAKKLVELMNGKIVVQSVYGKGSKFTVAIDQPIVNKKAEDLENTIKIDLNEIIDAAGKKVLIVDDNKVNLKVAARLLKNYNIESEEVSSGQECLDRIMNGAEYDMILLDDMMPIMTGVETFKKLKLIPGFNIPTIALTANALSGMKEKYLDDGFDDYISKPIERQELNRVVKKFLDK